MSTLKRATIGVLTVGAFLSALLFSLLVSASPFIVAGAVLYFLFGRN